jgi:pimeloyl-ACP methyl ester carboxylesterase
MKQNAQMNVVIADPVRDAVTGKGSPRSWLNMAGRMACLALTGRPAWGDELHPPVREPGQSGVVFAINGSGSLQATSTALARAVADAGLPLAVVVVEWSQGSIVADQTDWRHAREEGCRLAGQIASYRQACPGQAIYLVAHSAGSGVALTAAAAAPPGSVNRVILLAPSVSTDYDLRPALRGTRDSRRCCPVCQAKAISLGTLSSAARQSRFSHGHAAAEVSACRCAAPVKPKSLSGVKTGHGGKSEKSACAFVTD